MAAKDAAYESRCFRPTPALGNAAVKPPLAGVLEHGRADLDAVAGLSKQLGQPGLSGVERLRPVEMKDVVPKGR